MQTIAGPQFSNGHNMSTDFTKRHPYYGTAAHKTSSSRDMQPLSQFPSRSPHERTKRTHARQMTRMNNSRVKLVTAAVGPRGRSMQRTVGRTGSGTAASRLPIPPAAAPATRTPKQGTALLRNCQHRLASAENYSFNKVHSSGSCAPAAHNNNL